MQEFRDRFDRLEETISGLAGATADVHTAIVGKPEVGIKGLAQRMTDAEITLKTHDHRFTVWGAWIAGAVAVVGLAAKALHFI